MPLRLTSIVLAALLAVSLSACGGCDTEDGQLGDDLNASTQDVSDVAPEDAVGDSVGDTREGDTLGGDTPDVDLDIQSAEDAFTDADSGSEPPPEDRCPSTYQRHCDDTCVNIKIDPDHCGACDNACGTGEVCSGGACAETCLGAETVCGRTCVQTGTDNNHCGGCDRPCPDGEGCNNGTCAPAAIFDTPAICEGGGPPIIIGEEEEFDQCAGDLAEEKFRWAMCTCQDVNLTSGGLFTDAFDSLQGPYVPGVLGASVGVNADFKCTADVDIGGSMWVGGPNDLDLRGRSTIRMDMLTGRHMSAGGSLGVDVLENAAVGSSISPGGGGVRIADTLTVPDALTMRAGVTYGQLVRAPVDVPLPCQCAADEIIPTAEIIEARENDN
ncbi:MAG: hypothetical protein ACNA8W_17275, partial [Bradymonadaceae bacterium]